MEISFASAQIGFRIKSFTTDFNFEFHYIHVRQNNASLYILNDVNDDEPKQGSRPTFQHVSLLYFAFALMITID